MNTINAVMPSHRRRMRWLRATGLIAVAAVLCLAWLRATPVAEAYPVGTGCQLAVSSSTADAGHAVVVQGTGFTPGVTAQISADLTPPVTVPAVADADGRLTVRIVLPADAAGTVHISSSQGCTVDVTASSPISTRSTDGGMLASTGVQVSVGLVIAAVLLAVGILVLLATRRSNGRTRNDRESPAEL